MKILSGELEPTSGNVSLDPNERLGKLNQDQFAYEEHSVIDTVIMGHKELWAVKQERDRIYSLPEMSEEDGIKVPILRCSLPKWTVIPQKAAPVSCCSGGYSAGTTFWPHE